MKKNKILYAIALTCILFIGFLAFIELTYEAKAYIKPIYYDPYYSHYHGGWCCTNGTTACVPNGTNCP